MTIPNTITISSTATLLSRLGISFSYRALKEELETHPDYPSLFSVYQLLANYGVPTQAVQADAKYLNDWSPPFLVRFQMPLTGADFACVTNVENEAITIEGKQGQKYTHSKDDFLKKWDGIALLPDKKAIGAMQPDAEIHLAKDAIKRRNNTLRATVIITGLFIILAYFIWIHTILWYYLLPWLTIKLIGIAAAGLLLVYEVNRNSETIKQYCTANRQVNCDSVLQSRGAKLGGISWSIIGFAWMAIMLITLLSGLSGAKFVATMSMAALPYIVFSIYYQRFVIKQWCLLCLAVQTSILGEAIWVIFLYYHIGNVSISMPNLIMPTILSFSGISIIIAVWHWLLPIMQNGTKMNAWRAAYKRIIKNETVFFEMLKRQERAPDGYKECSLLFGNPNAKYEILKVCNPYCEPCAKVHPIFEELIKTNNEVCFRVIYIAAMADNISIGKVIHHFISLYYLKGIETAEKAMSFWYSLPYQDEAILFESFPIEDSFDTSLFREKMSKWENNAGIKGTPTIYINGYLLPKEIDRFDLKIILKNS